MKKLNLPIQSLIVGIVAILIVVLTIGIIGQPNRYTVLAYPPPYPGPGSPVTTLSPSPGPDEPPKIPTPTSTQEIKLVSITIEITIDGLEGYDEAELELLPGTQITSDSVASLGVLLPELKAENGKQTIRVENIPVGAYQIVVNAPPEYFRDPKGYLFGASENRVIMNSTDNALNFKLIPPSDQSLPPCRDFNMLPEASPPRPEQGDTPFEKKEVCMAEGIVDLLGPRMKVEGESLLTPEFYHYAGPKTFQDNQGVWGRNTVVNPGLTHDGSFNQFVAERVYADNGNNWIEAGWKEDSWRDDRQSVYVSGSFNGGQFIYFDQYPITNGSLVETEVYYDPNIAMWKALYFLGGTSWAVLRQADLGFIIADNGYNRGEVYTTNEIHPTLPPSVFDVGYLMINGGWWIWDTDFLTEERSDEPYQLEMKAQYYNFIIYSPVIYLPLIRKH
jgi:hypothetical protein